MLEKIASSDADPELIVRETQRVVLKKSIARRTAAEKAARQHQQQ